MAGLVVGVVSCGLLAGAVPASAGSSTGTWGRAEELPGSGALNKGGNAELSSVSCWSPGDCLAGGTYTRNATLLLPTGAFLAAERHGTWAKVQQVPGLAVLNKGRFAQLNSVSCASAGNCSAGGWYQGRAGDQQAFVVSERDGVWGKATKVSGSGGFNAGGNAGVFALSCGSAGDCSAGGYDYGTAGAQRGFVVTEHDGIWGKAVQVPGLGKGGYAEVYDVSCSGARNCAAGGVLTVRAGEPELFVMTERDGSWGSPTQIPGYAALNYDSPSSSEALESMSCPSAGDCAAGGLYTDEYGLGQAFVVSERDGIWGKAMPIPGSLVDNDATSSDLYAVSCASAGDCSAGGMYAGTAGNYAFVITQADGVWGRPQDVPGLTRLGSGRGASIGSISCTSPGDCGAGGYYTDARNRVQAFVVSETDGTWGSAELIPGSEALNKGGFAGVTDLSCSAAGRCTAGGTYLSTATAEQVFVVTEN